MESSNSPADQSREAGGKEPSSGGELAKQIMKRVSDDLSFTLFACKSLTILPSGTTNFVFRGTLHDASMIETPDSNGRATRPRKVETVVVKVIEGYARLNPAIRIDIRRGPFEASMLRVLNSFAMTSLSIGVRAPRLLDVVQAKNTLVIEDFGPDCVDLKDLFLNADNGTSLEYMRSLGEWLRGFHDWTVQEEQRHLREAMKECEESGRFKRDLMYGSIPDLCDKVGLLDDETWDILRQVDELLAREFEDSKTGHTTDDWGPIHGDFWTGNILNPNRKDCPENPDLSVVDWEFAHLGLRAYDLGQMVGDLIEKYEVSGYLIFKRAIDSLVEGYGRVSRKMAFRILIHAGVQLVNWHIRGPTVGLSDDGILRIVKMGRDMIEWGLKENEQWFRDRGLGRILDLTYVVPLAAYMVEE
ncbi:hypothetical protein LQW54_013368 [Pestalotiopsis sp. IQ-011]